MRKTMRTVLLLVALALFGVWLCAGAGASGYAVQPIPPECQEDQEAWYYDFTAEPGDVIILQAIIMNINGEDIQVEVEANAASTNCNGLIEFVKTDEKDPSLAVDFGEICVPVEPIVTVPAMSEVVAEFVLTMPEEPFEGILYGGFLFTMLGQDAQEGPGAMGVANVFRYAIGARIRQSTEPVAPEFELLGAELDTSDTPALVLNLRNPVPALARGVSINAKLYPKDKEEPLSTFARSGIEMAPSTLMPYRIDLMDNELPEAGEYKVVLELTFGENAWAFETALKAE